MVPKNDDYLQLVNANLNIIENLTKIFSCFLRQES